MNIDFRVFSLNMRFFILLFVVSSLCLAGQVSWAAELESPVDVRLVSQLRVELRSAHEPERCHLLWKGIQDKLEDKSSLDVVVLAKLGQFLKTKLAYKLLAEFVEDCVVALSARYKALEAAPAKKQTEADFNDEVGFLLQEIDTLRLQLADKEKQLAINGPRNDATLSVKVEQLKRERDEAMREVNNLKLELEEAKRSASHADAAQAELKDAIEQLHRSSEMAVQQIKDEPGVRGYESTRYNQMPHQVEQPYESIPNPYASATAGSYNWPAPALPRLNSNIGSRPYHQASFASAYASASV